jgi:predicted dehydrogenase
VLRYTPFYRKLKQLIMGGLIGRTVSLNAVEGVGAFHQAHSFVRGHWSNTKKSSPMILAKSCHDLDIIRWLVDASCTKVASFGSNSWFHSGNRPDGAPLRCPDGCPVEKDCLYNARRYLEDQEAWLSYVMPGYDTASREERERWLAGSPWSRCVYQCDNDTVDHQTVNMLFVNEVTATFTMTAFDGGRNIQIYGTEGRLYGGDFLHRVTGHWFVFEPNEGPRQTFDIAIPAGGYDGHLGGDSGLVSALYEELTGPEESMTSPLEVSVDSHLMAFAAEESRLAGRIVEL